MIVLWIYYMTLLIIVFIINIIVFLFYVKNVLGLLFLVTNKDMITLNFSNDVKQKTEQSESVFLHFFII